MQPHGKSDTLSATKDKPASEQGEKFNYALLCIATLVVISTNYADDGILAPVQEQVIEYFDIDSFLFNILSTVYAWSVIFTGAAGGLIVDKIGIKYAMMTFIIILYLGYLSKFIAGISKSYTMLLVSRVIMACGSEPLQNSLYVLIGLYFKKEKLGIVFALLGFGVVFALGIYIVSTLQIYKATSMTFILMYPMFNLIMVTVLLTWFFIKNDPKERASIINDRKKTEDNGIINTNNMSNINATATDGDGSNDNDNDTTNGKCNLKDISKLSRIYWYYLLSVMIVDGVTQSFFNVNTDLLSNTYGISQDSATFLVGSIIPIYFLLIFVVGLFNDRYGYRGQCWVIAMFGHCCTWLIFLFLRDWVGYIVIALIFLVFASGIKFAMQNACILLIVKDVKLRGTAYGLLSSSRYGASGTFSLFVGILTDDNAKHSRNKYNNVLIFQLLWLIVSLIFGIMLLRLDDKNDRSLRYKGNPRNKKNSNNKTKQEEQEKKLSDPNINSSDDHDGSGNINTKPQGVSRIASNSQVKVSTTSQNDSNIYEG